MLQKDHLEIDNCEGSYHYFKLETKILLYLQRVLSFSLNGRWKAYYSGYKILLRSPMSAITA